MNKKEIIQKYGRVLSFIYRLLHHNKIKVACGNSVSYKGVFLNGCTINVCGKNNTVCIQPGLTRLYNCRLTILSSNCNIVIGTDSNLHDTSLYIEDNGGGICIGKHVTISGKTDIAVIEGRKVVIGDECLFSANIQIRVGDSHSIMDAATGKRINPSKDVVIGNHVWIGNTVNILKGSVIADNSIVGTCSVVTGKLFPSNCIIGGSPAKVLKEGVNWDPHRLFIK